MSPLVPKPPCYDESTHTDCSDRKSGCRSECERWQNYEVARMKYYKERLIEKDSKYRPISRRALKYYYERMNKRKH